MYACVYYSLNRYVFRRCGTSVRSCRQRLKFNVTIVKVAASPILLTDRKPFEG